MDLIDLSLWLSYLLVIVSTLAAIILPTIQSLDNPKSLVKSGVALGVILVVFIFGYLISDGDVPGVSETTAKMSGAGLISMYVFLFVALGAIVYSEISNLMK